MGKAELEKAKDAVVAAAEEWEDARRGTLHVRELASGRVDGLPRIAHPDAKATGERSRAAITGPADAIMVYRATKAGAGIDPPPSLEGVDDGDASR